MVSIVVSGLMTEIKVNIFKTDKNLELLSGSDTIPGGKEEVDTLLQTARGMGNERYFQDQLTFLEYKK